MFRRSIDTAAIPSDTATFHRLASEGNAEGVEVRHRPGAPADHHALFVSTECVSYIPPAEPFTLIIAVVFPFFVSSAPLYARLLTQLRLPCSFCRKQMLRCLSGLPLDMSQLLHPYAFLFADVCSACTVG